MTMWVLRRPASDEGWLEYATTAQSTVGEAPQCPVCGRYTGVLRWHPPFRVELEGYGRHWPDVGFGNTNDLLISQRAIEDWNLTSLKGPELLGPVEVAKAKWHGTRPERAAAFQVVRAVLSSDAIDDGASGVDREDGPACEVCRLAGVITKLDRIVLESENDVSRLDLHFIRGLPGVLMCSERLAERMRTSAVLGARLLPAAEFSLRA